MSRPIACSSSQSRRAASGGAAADRAQLRRHGFRIWAIHKQFVLPIALHKSIGSPGFTKTVEGGLAAVGLLRLAGSPVTVAAERCAS